MGVVIVHHMEITMSTSWHSLNESFPKVVKGNSNLHILVLSVGITMPHKHDLVMMSQVIIRNGNRGRPVYGVDQPVVTIRQRAMVDPNMAPAEDRHTITVRYSPPPIVRGGGPHISVSPLLTVVYIDPVNNNIRHVLYSDARTISNVHTRTPAINGLKRVHYQFLLQFDNHVPGKYDPQRLFLNDGVAERPGLRIDHIIVARVRHDVNLAVSSANGVLTESDGAVRQFLTILLPIGVTTPAVVDGITRVARQESKFPSRIIQLPVYFLDYQFRVLYSRRGGNERREKCAEEEEKKWECDRRESRGILFL